MQVHLCQSPPPSTGLDVHPSHNTSRRPSLFLSYVMATGLHFNGPMRAFRVIEPGIKTIKVDNGGKTETITVDRLKPAHLDLNCPVEVAQPRPRGRPKGSTSHQARGTRKIIQPSSTDLPQCTRSGRQVNRPCRYIPFLGGSVV